MTKYWCVQAPSLGDINGDGVLEVVIATASGAVHALSGISGRDVAPFPFRTRGRITAPVLLVRLRDAGPALHTVVQSYDGHLYAIDGITGGTSYVLGPQSCQSCCWVPSCLTTQK